MKGLGEAIAIAVSRLLATEPGARLACVNVWKSSLLSIDPVADAQGRNIHLQRRVELKHWARASSALRRYLGSVSVQVVAQAPCTVTVVRTAASA